MEQGDGSSLSKDLLESYRDKPIHLFIRDGVLRDQLQIILAMLKFSRVMAHRVSSSYLESVRQLAKLVMFEEGVFLISPPMAAFGADGRTRVPKSLPEFFTAMKVLLEKANRDVMKCLSQCVPVFSDIEFAQKREKVLLALSRFGVSGVFILKKQETLANMTPGLRKVRMEEQIRERFVEIRDYLCEYLPHMDGALEALKEKKEEIELSQRKAEADKWMLQGDQAKNDGDFERAIHCFAKAINVYPIDPHAYLESGRVYVRVKKYPKALLRFAQAEEVAQGLPEPNKEIGNVRILQARQRIEAGESPNSPGVKALLDDALENYSAALKKASRIKPLIPEEERERNVEAVTRIASEIVKLDLKNLLGKRHPMVRMLGSVARDAFEKVAPGREIENMPAGNLIFLGLAAIDEQRYDEAERLLFKAAADDASFSEACAEISYLGTVLRRREGPARAIDIYRKLLDLSPPNRAAVNYNISVAYAANDNELEAAGALVESVFLDPSLPENDLFYKNHQLYGIMDRIVPLFARIVKRAEILPAPEVVRRYMQLQEKLERTIGSGEDEEAFRMLWLIAAKTPEFFKREEINASRVVINYIKEKIKTCSEDPQPKVVKFAKFLEAVLKHRKRLKFSKRLVAYNTFKLNALEALGKEDGRARAANYLARAVFCHPEYVESPYMYANEPLLDLAREINDRVARINLDKIKGFFSPSQSKMT